MSLSPPPPRKNDDNEWMLTYADVITLLLAFFVILFSMSTLKVELFEQVKADIVEGQNKTLVSKIQELSPRTPKQSKVSEQFRFFVPKLPTKGFLKKVVGIKEDNSAHDSTLVIPAKGLFFPGSTKMLKKSEMVLDHLVEYLNQMDPSIFEVSIEGHYDQSSPIPDLYDSKWEFSAARALNLRKALLEKGYNNPDMYIVAFGDSKPNTPEIFGGRVDIKSLHKNRRMIIRIRPKSKRNTSK